MKYISTYNIKYHKYQFYTITIFMCNQLIKLFVLVLYRWAKLMIIYITIFVFFKFLAVNNLLEHNHILFKRSYTWSLSLE